MKVIPLPTPGVSGPRRPRPSVPINYRRDCVSDLRRLPIRNNPRLEVLDYCCTPPTTKSEPCRTIAHGSARLAGHILLFSIARSGGVVHLETEARCWEEPADRREAVAWLPQIMADLLHAIEQKNRAAQAATHIRLGSTRFAPHPHSAIPAARHRSGNLQ